jgi:putative membrane protein
VADKKSGARGPSRRGPALTDAEMTDIDWQQAPFIAASGVCMGTADVVPGVSGGTMAVALGIYARLLAAIASINGRSLRALATLRLRDAFSILHWRFMVTLAGGIGVALVVMLKVVKLPELLETHQSLVYGVFFGLVSASALVLGRRIPWTATRIVALLAGTVAGFVIVTLVPVETPEHPLFIFFSGFIAICAMLLPGISGSFILLILGKYAYVLDAVSHLKFGVIIPFALGCLSGLLTFARVVGWLLRKWEHTTIAVLTGLLVGSLWRIWPYQHIETVVVRDKPRIIGATPFLPSEVDLGVPLLFVLGFGAVIFIEYVASKRHATVAVEKAHATQAD